MIKSMTSNRVVFLLSVLGLAVASFLAYEYNFSSSVACPVAGGGCDVVRASSYSSFLGISIPYLGIAFYLFMLVLSVLRSHKLADLRLKKLQFLAALSAFLFGVYLTYLEGFVIGSYCFWCVTSFMISIGILFFSRPFKDE